MMILPGPSMALAEDKINDELSGIWEQINDGGASLSTVLTLNMEKGVFEETTKVRDHFKALNYTKGRIDGVRRLGRETSLIFVNEKAVLMTLKPEDDGDLSVYYQVHLGDEGELRPDIAHFRFQRPPGTPKTVDRPHPAGLHGVWLMDRDKLRMSLTLDWARKYYSCSSDYGIIQAGFSIVETRPDRYFVALTDFSIESKLTLEADGTLSITSGTEYVERYKKVR
jgi:hypothetical protein